MMSIDPTSIEILLISHIPVDQHTSLWLFVFFSVCAISVFTDAFKQSQENETLLSERFIYAYACGLLCLTIGLLTLSIAYLGQDSVITFLMINCIMTLIVALLSCQVKHHPIKNIVEFCANPFVIFDTESLRPIVTSLLTLLGGSFVFWCWLRLLLLL